MQRKLKLQKLLIFVLAALISVVLMTILLGRSAMVEVYVIGKSGIDLTQPIGSQAEEFLVKRKMSKEDFDKFAGTLLTPENYNLFADMTPVIPLHAGSPVPVSALVKDAKGGELVSNLEKHHVIYRLPAANTLPPGFAEGDKIDIAIITQHNGVPTTGIVLRDVSLYSVEGANVYIKVTQSEQLKLVLAERLGEFVIQLPGRKEVPECTEEELENRRIEDIQCYVSEDDLDIIKQTDVLEQILSNQN